MLRLLLTIIALGLAASAVFASEQDCFQARDHQLRIQGCSQIIQRDPNDATAYHNRAFARGLAGDIDNAIADYSKVIEIAPENASAYVNRGRAYASKGEYTHAVADQTRAQELIAKAKAQPTVAPLPPTGALPPPTGAAKVPKVPKAPKKAVAAAKKAPTVPPKDKAIPEASKTVVEDPPASSSWWSWLWGNGAGANWAAGKNTRP
jgi:tetratricopeptide (TPR) repeat protein